MNKLHSLIDNVVNKKATKMVNENDDHDDIDQSELDYEDMLTKASDLHHLKSAHHFLSTVHSDHPALPAIEHSINKASGELDNMHANFAKNYPDHEYADRDEFNNLAEYNHGFHIMDHAENVCPGIRHES